MSCSFEKILSDVKNLTQRLKNTDETTDKIIKDTSYFYVKLKSMNELQDKISILSNNFNKSTRSDISFEGDMENANLENLRRENRELRELLKEYQTALELIMSRYRVDMNNFMQITNNFTGSECERHNLTDPNSQTQIELDLTMKYIELYKMALESTSTAQTGIDQLEKSIENLHSENEMMRSVLGLIDRHFCADDSNRGTESDSNTGPRLMNHLPTESSVDHLFECSFSDDDKCSVSSDASVKTLI